MKKVMLVLLSALLMPVFIDAMNQGEKRKLPDGQFQTNKKQKTESGDSEYISRSDRKKKIKARRIPANTMLEAENPVPMSDDGAAMGNGQRTLVAPKTEGVRLQELADALSRNSGARLWQTRKQMIDEAYTKRQFDLKTFVYKQRTDLNQAVDCHPAMDAAFNSDADFMDWLLKHGADANAQGGLQSPVLFSACTRVLAKVLLDHGADAQALDSMGEPLSMITPLRGYDPELIPLYGAHGQASYASSMPGASPLMRLIEQACSYKTKETEILCKKARLMVLAGVDLRAQVCDGVHRGENYQALLKGEIAEEQRRLSNSFEHKQEHAAHIKKLEQLEKAIAHAIEERRGAIIQETARFLPNGFPKMVSEYAE